MILLLAAVAGLVNGGVWNDTNGVMINAHGGALMRDADTLYWYGEHKTEGGNGNKAWVGVHAYSSTNLVDWTDEGIAFAVHGTNCTDAACGGDCRVQAGCILERPKVMKAEDGSRYVMYFHLEPKGAGYNGAMTGIAESRSPKGPFKLVWTGRPNAGVEPVLVPSAECLVHSSGGDGWKITAPWGSECKEWRSHLEDGQMSRDMTLYRDPKDGKIYHVFASEDNSCLHIAELKADGLGYTGKWARISPGDWTEAPALVKHGEWYFLIGSGCTGWRANAARYYRAKSVWGPWERVANPCRGMRVAENGKSYGPEVTWNGQSTGIFEVNGTAFAMFDLWRPSNAIDGRYVWLPIFFNDRGEITIDWREEFSPSLAEPWEDEYVSEINRLPARSGLKPMSPAHVINLDGVWDFAFVNGNEREETKITVPSCWQLVGAREGKDWDPPLYTNIRYPIEYDPPRVMTEPKNKSWTSYRFRNPRGIYRRKVTLPTDWADRRVTLRLNGYSSAVYVRVNGKTVGYGEDGRLPNEFDLTPYVFDETRRNGETEFCLELEVLKHCDGTYLEDQDFWRMSGLFRSVELLSEPKNGIFDFNVMTRVAGTNGIVSVKADTAKAVTWRVYDAKGDELCRGRGSEELLVRNVQLWSGKNPYLYRIRVECAGESYEKRFGFRTVTIEDGILKLNGERVVIHGVDRHEMSPKGGYAMTREEMRRDIEVMKKIGINAVRTSHYPDDLYWYELCDENGILVVAEANIECHGSGHPLKSSALSHVRSWRKSFVERNINQVAVLRDHPSIIGWSLGNESGTGENMIAAYDAVKAADPTRPVQYEGILNSYGKLNFDVYGTDIIAPMYETPAKVEEAMKKGFKRPYILCEYSHAMGNSNGNFDEYMALIEKYPRFQGGFIWDFADQALEMNGKLKIENGKCEGPILRYGGDFGDSPNDRHFHCNGLFDAWRNPHPGAYEVAAFYLGQLVPSADSVHSAQCLVPSAESEDTPITNHYVLSTNHYALSTVFYRAWTDNDRGARLDRKQDIWRKATEEGILPAGVETNLVVMAIDGGLRLEYTVKIPEVLADVPRIGLEFELPGGMDTPVKWHGRGPYENYIDRKCSAAIGDWAMSVRELDDSHYVRPQECGHREDVTRLEVGGTVITSETPFGFNVLPWTTAEIAAARHVEELPAPNGKLHVIIDAAHSGVGGDDSWGHRAHDQYLLKAGEYRLAIEITGQR